jgi:hypothetical protein
MTVRVLVEPTGPKATPEAIESWKQKAQRVADEYDVGLTLNTFAEDGVTIVASIEAIPGDEEFDWEPEVSR